VGTKGRVFDEAFKRGIVERILKGENVSALSREYQIKRTLLYRWRDAYRKQGVAGISRTRGRPPGTVGEPARRVSKPTSRKADQERIADLERRLGQMSLENAFLSRAFERVKELRRSNSGSGVVASTERSEP
jgi:transposase